ncbi:hypothetical protein V565_126100 [Rhizoctonia solani 123E]|uniref:Uncharacterized protein n=1 Tax=Rhizoctonia solani 123E TaxID=1423351 RepID=A0A074SEE1_9AGAM|nr:hypothetical protein V565_126100 [Rhizoctonia solani 123E]
MVQAIAETAQNLINMREAFKRAEQNTVNLDVFRLGYNDWLKAYRFSLGHLPMWESPHSPLHGRLVFDLCSAHGVIIADGLVRTFIPKEDRPLTTGASWTLLKL